MIKVDKEKLEKIVLNEMADFEYNNWSEVEVCIGEFDDFQVMIKITRDDLHDEVKDKFKCVSDSC